MKKSRILFAGIMGWLVVATMALGATWYVDAARSDDSGEGTDWSTAKQTLQAAVDCAADGDILLVTDWRLHPDHHG